MGKHVRRAMKIGWKTGLFAPVWVLINVVFVRGWANLANQGSLFIFVYLVTSLIIAFLLLFVLGFLVGSIQGIIRRNSYLAKMKDSSFTRNALLLVLILFVIKLGVLLIPTKTHMSAETVDTIVGLGMVFFSVTIPIIMIIVKMVQNNRE